MRGFPPPVTGGKLPPITEGVTPSQATDAELLADSAHPAESFAVFYRRHAEAVLKFTAMRGADAETAADVVAETFFAALQRRAKYDARYESARLWLFGIAMHKLADVRRREEREQRRVARAAAEAVVLSDVDRSTYDALLSHTDALDALADLPAPEREAIRARVVEDRSYAEIADALGLTEPATRKRVSRGLARLRTLLERSP